MSSDKVQKCVHMALKQKPKTKCIHTPGIAKAHLIKSSPAPPIPGCEHRLLSSFSDLQEGKRKKVVVMKY